MSDWSRVCVWTDVLFMLDQTAVVESVVEGTADSGPASTEPTAKPPPFKDPAFMVTGCGGVWCVPVSWLTPNVLSLFFSFTLYSIPGSVEPQLVKRTERGKILNRFWLWSELYRGS